MTLHYSLAIHDPAAHEFAVELHVAGDAPSGLLLTLPAWIPGSYMIRDFARNIVAIEASDAAGPLPLDKTDKQTWQAPACRGRLRVRYLVYAWDLSVRSACLDPTRAYFNGPALFLRVAGYEDADCELTLNKPAHPACADWTVSTSMPALVTDARGFGTYHADDYAALLDYPVEIGTQVQFGFAVGGVPHGFAVTEGGHFDQARLARDLARICAEHAAMFGELPVTRYLFLTLALGEGYGGLEHRDSTSLVCKRSDLPAAGMDRPDKGYRRFMALCSHEYFHLWNVKRIRPARLAAADLSAEVHTELLWAFEGITSYYDELALLRSGCLSIEDYLDLFATTVTRVMRGAGRQRQSIAESSFDAWTRFYKQDENAPNAIVSYYAKGALVAFGLDVTMRVRSAGRVGLDDLMRDLWERYGRSGTGVPERGIESRVAAVLGEPLDDFFAAYVYGTAELPLGGWFASLGIDYRLRPARAADDQGGFSKDMQDPGAPRMALGARLSDAQGWAQVTQVARGGAAHVAGLAAGDTLVALDGERVSVARVPDLLRRHAPGSTLTLHAMRRDRLLQLELEVVAAPPDTCMLGLLAGPGEEVLARRAAWSASATGGADA